MIYAIREALAAFRRAPLLTSLSGAMIALSLFVVGLFGIVAHNIRLVLHQVEERVEVVAYLRDGTTPQVVELISAEIASFPEVAAVDFVSKDQALAQCRRWLEQNLPAAERIETASTTVAARRALEEPEAAAIAAGLAAEVYGLVPLAEAIEDRRDNSTRFLVVGGDPPAPSGSDLTSLLFTIRRDEAGGLHRLIEPMAREGVNLTSIQLRPIKGKPWEYLFFIDCEGHRSEAPVARALEAASRIAHSTRVLGSYPRAESARERGRGGR